MELKKRQMMGTSYVGEVRQDRAYRVWVELDYPIQPPIIAKKIKGSGNEIYNHIRLIPLEGDKWGWERYFKAKSRRDACVLMNNWIRASLGRYEYFKNKPKPWNQIAFVEDCRNELFYCSDMDLWSDAFCYVPLEIADSICIKSKGELEFNKTPASNAQRYSFKRAKSYKKPKDPKLKNHLFLDRKTENYYILFNGERYTLLTSDQKKARRDATLVLKNIRKGLSPFHHKQEGYFDNRAQNNNTDSFGQTHKKLREGCQKNQKKNKNGKGYNTGNSFARKNVNEARIKELESRLKKRGVVV